jgi:hypothetical protein
MAGLWASQWESTQMKIAQNIWFENATQQHQQPPRQRQENMSSL